MSKVGFLYSRLHHILKSLFGLLPYSFNKLGAKMTELSKSPLYALEKNDTEKSGILKGLRKRENKKKEERNMIKGPCVAS